MKRAVAFNAARTPGCTLSSHTRVPTRIFGRQAICVRPLQQPLAANFDLSALDLEVPDIDGDLRSVQQELGAIFDDDGVALTYNNSQQALDAPESGVALVDRSNWPRLIISGRDRIPLLQRYTTADYSNLSVGQGCDTVLLDVNGHTLDLVTTFLAESHVMMIVSPGSGVSVMAWLKQHAAEGDLKVVILDVSERCSMVSLIGPESENVLKELTGGELVPGLTRGYGSHTLLKFRGTPLLLGEGCGVPFPGYTLIADEAVAGELFSVLAMKGCILMGQQEWECSRVLAGRPAVGSEIGTSFLGHTPLEAGLYHAVSLSKVIGYKGLQALADAEAWGHKQELWGLQLEADSQPGTTVMSIEGIQKGIITSFTTTPSGRRFALAYVDIGERASPQQDELHPGKTFVVDGKSASLASLPFASRQFLRDLLAGNGEKNGIVLGPGSDSMAKQAEQERVRQAEEKAAEELERLKRIEDNRKKLEAWQAAQLGQTFKQK